MAGKAKYSVMVSSTFEELAKHRDAVLKALLSHDLFPVAMENDAARPEDLIAASLAKVTEADGYIGLIGYRYGQTPECASRNPEQLSLTHLEFRRAVELGIPICMFIMHRDHLIPMGELDRTRDEEKRKAFIAEVNKALIFASFESIEDLRAKVLQSLPKLREAMDKRAAPAAAPAGTAPAPAAAEFEPPQGWAVIDRTKLAEFRAQKPTAGEVITFFDGMLPTWRLALAPGLQPRAVVETLVTRLRAVHVGAAKPEVVLLSGAGGEGKSTAVLHAAALLLDDPEQRWRCLHRHATAAPLPEDLFQKLPRTPGAAWVVLVDDADNIGPSLLAAAKRMAPRTDVHLMLAARDADWQMKRLHPGLWHSVANFHAVPLSGLTPEDARKIVASWRAWGDAAMGKLRGSTDDEAVAALLGHARELATRKEDGELLGALLVTRQGEDMRAHVRTLVEGLGRTPVFKAHSLRDVYMMVAAMHAENQLYLSRSVLAYALGCDPHDLERSALAVLRAEAMLDAGNHYVLTRHRRIAEAACTVVREDGEDVDRWYPFLARAAHLAVTRKIIFDPDIASWRNALANHFAEHEHRWPVARAVAQVLYESHREDPHRLTVYSSTLRRTERPVEAMAILRATEDKFCARRDVLYEWSTVAGAIGDYGLDAWLAAKSLADGREPVEPLRAKLSLAGLGAAFRELFLASSDRVYSTAQGACGQMGLRLHDLDATTKGYFETYVAQSRRAAVGELAPEKAVEAIRQAAILAANEMEGTNDPAFFERILDEPDRYRYTALLRLVGDNPKKGAQAARRRGR